MSAKVSEPPGRLLSRHRGRVRDVPREAGRGIARINVGLVGFGYKWNVKGWQELVRVAEIVVPITRNQDRDLR